MKGVSIFLLAVVMAGAGAWGRWGGARTDVNNGSAEASAAGGVSDGKTGQSGQSGQSEQSEQSEQSGQSEQSEALEALEALEAAVKDIADPRWADWARRIARAKAGDFPALMEEARKAPTDEPDSLSHLLIARWAEVDPQTAWAKAVDWGDEFRGLVLAVWLGRDFSAAWEALAALNEKYDETLIEEAGQVLIEENPEILWQLAVKLRSLPIGAGDARWAALVRAHEDEAATLARDFIEKEGERGQNEVAWGTLKIVHQARAERDPQGALAWANALPEEERKMALCDVLPLAAKTDWEAAVEQFRTLGKLKDGPSEAVADVSQVARDMALNLGRSDPAKALEWLRSGDVVKAEAAGTAAAVLGEAMREGRLAPQEAYALANRLFQSANKDWERAVGKMWSDLPAEALTAAADWLRPQAASDPVAAQALNGLLGTLGRVDRQAAIACAATLPPEKRGEIYRAILSPAWDFDDPVATQAGQPSHDEIVFQPGFEAVPKEDRASLIEAEVRKRGAMPREGFDARPYADALDALGDPVAVREAAARLAKTWGRWDPLSAMGWARQQSDAGTQRAVLAAAMSGWVAADSWGASAWLAAQPGGPDRDAAAEQLATAIGKDEPDSAWKWAGSIADPAGRSRTMEAILTAWVKTDAPAARTALDNAGPLDEATASRLQQIFSTAKPPAGTSR